MANQNVSTMNIQLTMQGQQAEQGLNRIGATVESLAGKIEGITSLAKSFTFLEIGKKALEWVAGINQFHESAKRMSVQLGTAMGNVAMGSQAFKRLADLAITSKAPIEQLTSGFEALANAGLGLTDSLDIVGKAGKLDALFGGEGKGVAAITEGIAKLNKELVASSDSFDLLRSKGINAYQNLAKVLGTTADEAEKLLKAGKVTGFQGTQAIAQSLNSREAKNLAKKGDLGTVGMGWIDPRNWTSMTDKIGGELYGRFQPLMGLVEQLKVPGKSGATDINTFPRSPFKNEFAKNAEWMRALNANMEAVGKALKADLLDPLQGLQDQLAVLDQQLKLTEGKEQFQEVAKLIQAKKTKLIEDFAQVPLTTYEALGKQVKDLRDQIEKAGQGALGDRLKEKLKTLGVEGSTAGGPFDALAENLQKIQGQFDEASKKFGGSELNAKFAADQKAILDKFTLADNSPFAVLTESLKDLDAAAKRLRSFNMAPDKYMQAREELAKREEKLVADYQKSVFDPVITEGERFAQSLLDARLAIEKANIQGDFAGAQAQEKKIAQMLAGKLGKGTETVDQFFAGRAEAGSIEAWRSISKWQRSGLVKQSTVEERLAKAAELQLKENQKATKELDEIKKILNSKNPPPALVTIGWAGGPSKTKQ